MEDDYEDTLYAQYVAERAQRPRKTLIPRTIFSRIVAYSPGEVKDVKRDRQYIECLATEDRVRNERSLMKRLEYHYISSDSDDQIDTLPAGKIDEAAVQRVRAEIRATFSSVDPSEPSAPSDDARLAEEAQEDKVDKLLKRNKYRHLRLSKRAKVQPRKKEEKVYSQPHSTEVDPIDALVQDSFKHLDDALAASQYPTHLRKPVRTHSSFSEEEPVPFVPSKICEDARPSLLRKPARTFPPEEFIPMKFCEDVRPSLLRKPVRTPPEEFIPMKFCDDVRPSLLRKPVRTQSSPPEEFIPMKICDPAKDAPRRPSPPRLRRPVGRPLTPSLLRKPVGRPRTPSPSSEDYDFFVPMQICGPKKKTP